MSTAIVQGLLTCIALFLVLKQRVIFAIFFLNNQIANNCCTHTYTHNVVVAGGTHQLAANLLFANNLKVCQYRTPQKPVDLLELALLYDQDTWNIT